MLLYMKFKNCTKLHHPIFGFEYFCYFIVSISLLLDYLSWRISPTQWSVFRYQRGLLDIFIIAIYSSQIIYLLKLMFCSFWNGLTLAILLSWFHKHLNHLDTQSFNFDRLMIFGVLAPLSAIFQQYHGDQF